MASRAALRRREAGTGGSLTQPPVVPGRHEDAGTGSSLLLVGDSLVPVPVCVCQQLLLKIPSFGGRCRCRCPGSDAADDVILRLE